MEYDAVFWDVGGVIVDIDSMTATQRRFIETAVDAYDLDVEPEEALSIWRDAMREHFAGRAGREYRTARRAREKAADALFEGDPPPDWRERFEAIGNEVVKPNPGAVETIRALDEAGVYQAIVSDADAEAIPEMLDRFELRDSIDDITTSEEVGYVKPDSRMFETALEKADAAGVDPDRALMVGDKYKNDMEGGQTVGLTTVAYGADDGPAVDYRIEDLRELQRIVGLAD